MKKVFNQLLLLMLVAGLFSACEKDLEKAILTIPTSVSSFTASANNIVLSDENAASHVVTFKFNAPDYGRKVIPTYTVQFDVPADTTGPNAWGNAVDVKLTGSVTEKSFLGADLNAILATQLGLPVETASIVVVRLKSVINNDTGSQSAIPAIYSTAKLTVTPYKAMVVYPALLVIGGNSWKTPATRTDGFVLTSSKFNSKYEGYLDLPNADGWNGEAFTLKSTIDDKVYGWGTNNLTIAEGTGNLWLEPSPSYMKVNVDLNAGTINYTPVQFFITGDDNGWSTSATPMTYNAATKQWVATNVALTAGKAFSFTANGSYDISYKLDDTGKNFVFAGNPVWGGTNIPVAKTGVFTVTLDMSMGDGNYTYSVK